MSNRTKVGIAVVVVVVAVIGGGLFWFFRDDAPDEVSLDAATRSVTEPDHSDGDAAPATDGDVTGTWVVDTETGDFDYESATGTFAGFRIQEELARIGSTTAVGRTGDVAGSAEIDGTTVASARFDIDVSTITTNESRRDDRVQEALATDEFPSATFTLTEPIALGEDATSGEPVQVAANGELTIRGVSRPTQFDLEAQLVGDTIVVVGSTDITFSDFGVEVPSSPAVLSVEDHGTVELQLLLVRS